MQRGNVAVHGIERFGYDQLGSSGADLAQQALKMLDVVVAPNELLGTRLAHALNHSIVIELAGKNHAIGNELRDRRYAGEVRYVAGSKDEHRLLAMQIGELELKPDQGWFVPPIFRVPPAPTPRRTAV